MRASIWPEAAVITTPPENGAVHSYQIDLFGESDTLSECVGSPASLVAPTFEVWKRMFVPTIVWRHWKSSGIATRQNGELKRARLWLPPPATVSTLFNASGTVLWPD